MSTPNPAPVLDEMLLHTQLLLLSALRAIVHVGPHKVGSTSLQTALEEGRGTLASDNFALSSRFAGGSWTGAKSCANVANCLSGDSPHGINCTLVLTDFGKFLDGARRAGRSIILSAEKFDSPKMDIPSLAAALHGFETEVVVLHRPFFDWLQSLYSEVHPPMSLEEFAADRIPDVPSVRDTRYSVAVDTRYSQHFRNVTMRGLAAGYITRFVCIDVRAKACCHLQTTPETHVNGNKSVAYLFDWLWSLYSQVHPPMSLEEFAADRIIDVASVRDTRYSVAVYTRYSQHFRNVTMRGLAAGYITRFVCIDVRAKAFCRHLQTTAETHVNGNKSVAYWHGGCMTADQKEVLWAVSAVIEAQAQALMATGEMPMNLTELRDRFAQAPYRVC